MKPEKSPIYAYFIFPTEVGIQLFEWFLDPGSALRVSHIQYRGDDSLTFYSFITEY